MAVRLLHLSDLHLGSRHDYLDEGAEARAREVREAFRSAVNIALDPARGIGAVVISGNLFDQHAPDSETLSFVRGLLGRLVAARKPVVLLPGYRDALSYGDCVFRTERWPGVDVIANATPAAPVVHVIDGETVEFHGVAAQLGASPRSFPGFAGGEASSAPEEAGPDEIALDSRPGEPGDAPRPIRIGVLCCGIEDHPENEVRPHMQMATPDVLAESGMDYIALGGYHGFTCLRLGSTTAVWPGTLEGRRFEAGDLGQKHLLIAEIDRGRATLHREACGSAVLDEFVIDLTGERISSPDALAAALLARSGERVIARVIIRGPLEFLTDFEDVAAKVAPRFRHLELVDETDLAGSGLLRRIEGEHTIRGFFVRRMLGRIQALAARGDQAASRTAIDRELAVARRALKLGLGQFMEEEPAADVLYQAPEPRKAPLEQAPAGARPKEAETRANGIQVAEGAGSRTRALLRAERTEQNQGEI